MEIVSRVDEATLVITRTTSPFRLERFIPVRKLSGDVLVVRDEWVDRLAEDPRANVKEFVVNLNSPRGAE